MKTGVRTALLLLALGTFGSLTVNHIADVSVGVSEVHPAVAGKHYHGRGEGKGGVA